MPFVQLAIYKLQNCCICTPTILRMSACERPMLYSYSRPIEKAVLPLNRHGRVSARVPCVSAANVQPEGLMLKT